MGARAIRGRAVSTGVLALGLGAWAAVALAAPRDVTRSEAGAVARTVNLRAGDLRLTTASAVSVISVNPHAADATLVACQRPSPAAGAWAAARSPILTSGGAGAIVVSETLILPSASAVSTELHAVATRSVQRCLASDVQSQLEPSAPNERASVSVTPLPSAFDGGSGSTGIRLITRQRSAGSRGNEAATSSYQDLLFSQYGQALLELSFRSDRVPSEGLERSLARLLLSRAHAALQ